MSRRDIRDLLEAELRTRFSQRKGAERPIELTTGHVGMAVIDRAGYVCKWPTKRTELSIFTSADVRDLDFLGMTDIERCSIKLDCFTHLLLRRQTRLESERYV